MAPVFLDIDGHFLGFDKQEHYSTSDLYCSGFSR